MNVTTENIENQQVVLTIEEDAAELDKALKRAVKRISNQVSISSKRAELDTLNEQIDQQKTENEEMQRILSGDSDQITEWVARDSYNYAAPNERIFVDVTGS